MASASPAASYPLRSKLCTKTPHQLESGPAEIKQSATGLNWHSAACRVRLTGMIKKGKTGCTLQKWKRFSRDIVFGDAAPNTYPILFSFREKSKKL